MAVLAVLSLTVLSYNECPVMLSCPSCAGCPVLIVMSQLSCLVLALLPKLGCKNQEGGLIVKKKILEI
jgi:hypothetical protein